VLKKRFLLLLLLYLTQFAVGQNLSTPINFNHIYFVVDSTTYANIKANSFLSDTLFSISEEETKTTTMTYKGLYIMGCNHYIELFNEKGYEKAKIGDVGIGLYVHGVDGLEKFKKDWQEKTTDPIVYDPYIFGKDTAWIEVKNEKMDCPDYVSSIFNLAYPNSFFKKYKIPDSLIHRGMSYCELTHQFNNSDSIYKYFHEIENIKVSIAPYEVNRYHTALSVTGYQKKEPGKYTKTNDIPIYINNDYKSGNRIKEITIKLNKSVTPRQLILSENCTIDVEERSVVFKFK
jgi:hypothetical protein